MAVGIFDLHGRWWAIDPALQVYMGLSVNNCHHGVADEQYRDEIE